MHFTPQMSAKMNEKIRPRALAAAAQYSKQKDKYGSGQVR
jgi:hypothetical protein